MELPLAVFGKGVGQVVARTRCGMEGGRRGPHTRRAREEVQTVARIRRCGTGEARKEARIRRRGTEEDRKVARNALAKEEDQEGLHSYATVVARTAVRTHHRREKEEDQMAARTPNALRQDC